MKLFKVAMAVLGLGLLVLAFAPGIQAGNDVWNKKTTLTFSAPFEIPGGQVLSAGTYVFKLLDSPYDRDIVQITSKDERHVYATILAIPNQRLHAPENTIMRFEERAAGSPQAIKAWFHPGDRMGHEFVYPKVRAVELAKVENEPVPAMPTEVAPAITSSTAEQPAEALETAPLTAEEPTGEELPIARAFQPAPVESASLPKTASSMPLVGLIGMLSLAGAFGLWIMTRRAS